MSISGMRWLFFIIEFEIILYIFLDLYFDLAWFSLPPPPSIEVEDKRIKQENYQDKEAIQ